jgi:hypothetical protein
MTLSTTGLLEDDGDLAPYAITFPRESEGEYHSPRRDLECPRAETSADRDVDLLVTKLVQPQTRRGPIHAKDTGDA